MKGEEEVEALNTHEYHQASSLGFVLGEFPSISTQNNSISISVEQLINYNMYMHIKDTYMYMYIKAIYMY